MTSCLFPTRDELFAVFGEELQWEQGWLADSLFDDDRLVLRGVLPGARHIHGQDSVCRGVALRTCGHELYVQPYLQFRECGHGVIVSQGCEIKRFCRVGYLDDLSRAESVVLGLRSAMHRCARAELLETLVGQFRQAAEVRTDAARVVAFLKTAGGGEARIRSRMVQRIASHFAIDEDSSLLGAIKAISAVAQYVADPQLRWSLEALCGDVLESLQLEVSAVETPEIPARDGDLREAVESRGVWRLSRGTRDFEHLSRREHDG